MKSKAHKLNSEQTTLLLFLSARGAARKYCNGGNDNDEDDEASSTNMESSFDERVDKNTRRQNFIRQSLFLLLQYFVSRFCLHRSAHTPFHQVPPLRVILKDSTFNASTLMVTRQKRYPKVTSNMVVRRSQTAT